MKIKSKIISRLMSRFDIGKIDKFISGIPVVNAVYKFFAQRTVNYDFPTHIFVESTSVCNFRCKMCPRTEGDILVGNMDFAIFKKVIDEAGQYGPRSFSLYLFGEPLLAPQIIEMVKYIKQSNPDNVVVITTNGSLLTKEKSEALVDSQVDKLAVSFVSPNKETYLEKTGIDKLEQVEKNIEQLIAVKNEKKSAKPLIFARMIVGHDTAKQAGEFVKKWKGKKVAVELRDMHNYGGHIQESYVKNTRRYPCYHPWLAPAIHWNGDFTICCTDYERKTLLGNIKEKTIHEMWTGEKIKNYRKLHLQGKYSQISPCSNCDVWNIYSDLFFNWQKR